MKMPSETEALQLIEEAGHKLTYEYGRVCMVEWGDTPCCGPLCSICGDTWCLWESYLDIQHCTRAQMG